MKNESAGSEKIQSPGTAMIEITDLHKWFGEFHVLQGIDLSVRKQERIVICGPSGSGKSTLIRCINRLEDHQRGRIVVDGIELTSNIKNIEKVRTEVGMVFSTSTSFPTSRLLKSKPGPDLGEKGPKERSGRGGHVLPGKGTHRRTGSKIPGTAFRGAAAAGGHCPQPLYEP